MKNRRPGPFILLVSCSYCNEDFEDGRARHMLGSYPMEQFCTYRCVENYLANDRGLTPALPVTPMIFGKGTFHHMEKDADRSHPVTSEKSRTL